MTDELSTRLADLLDGTYDCVDRIVLNGYHSVCYSAGGFRLWWRSLTNVWTDPAFASESLDRLFAEYERHISSGPNKLSPRTRRKYMQDLNLTLLRSRHCRT